MFNRKRKKEQIAESPIYNLEAQVKPDYVAGTSDDMVCQEQDDSASQDTDVKNAETADEVVEIVKKLDETEKKEETEAAMMQAFEAWLEDSIADEKRREAAREAMGLVHDAMAGGEFDDAIFDVIAKGADYDRAIAEAVELGEAKGFEAGEAKGREEGEVNARNADIDRYFEDAKGDGVPHPGSGSTKGSSRGFSIFDLARSANV